MEHETAVELLHRAPQLAAILLASAGVAVPAGASAVIADSNLSARKPLALAAEAVIVLTAPAGKLAVVTEVQKHPPKKEKRRAWPAYVTIAGVEHECDAILIVIALRPDTARASGRLIRTGHPEFNLRPIVIGPGNTPRPGSPATGRADAELAVLGVLTGALDLNDPQARLTALQALARADPGRRAAYTRVIRRHRLRGGTAGTGGTDDDPLQPQGRIRRRAARPGPRRRRSARRGAHAAADPPAPIPPSLRHGATWPPPPSPSRRSSATDTALLAESR